MGRLSQRPRLVKQRSVARISAPRAHEPEHHKRENAEQCRAARMADGEPGGVGGLGPAALVELQAGTIGEQIEEPQVEASLAAVLDPGCEAVCRGRICVCARRPRRDG